MKSKVTALIAIVSFIVNMDAFAAPLNDNFINAGLISGISGSVTGNNVNATLETGEYNLVGNGATNSVWWKWQAPNDGHFAVNTYGSTNIVGSEFDSMLGFHTGDTVETTVMLAEVDSGLADELSMAVVSGTLYYIQIEGYNNNTSPFLVINWFQPLTTVYMSPFGSDSNSGANPGSPVKTMPKALGLVMNSGIISLATGTYSMADIYTDTEIYGPGGTNITIRKAGVEIVGNSPADTIIYCGPGYGGIRLEAPDTKLRNIQIHKVGTTAGSQTTTSRGAVFLAWDHADRVVSNVYVNCQTASTLAIGGNSGANPGYFYNCLVETVAGNSCVNLDGKPGFFENCTFIGGDNAVYLRSSGADANLANCMLVSNNYLVSAAPGTIAHFENSAQYAVTNQLTGGGTITSNNLIGANPMFVAQDGFPFRCGVGNAGWMARKGGIYFAARNNPTGQFTLGLSKATGWGLPSEALFNMRNLPTSPENIGTLMVSGSFTNDYYPTVAIERGLQYANDYIAIVGEDPTNTLIYKTHDAYASGRNLTIYPVGKKYCEIRNISLISEQATGDGGYSVGSLRNWQSSIYLSNVYVAMLSFNTSTWVVSYAEPTTPAYCSANGPAFINAHNSCFVGGAWSVRINWNTGVFNNCTFVNGTFAPDGDAAGGYGMMISEPYGGGTYNVVEANYCIFATNSIGSLRINGGANTSEFYGANNIMDGPVLVENPSHSFTNDTGRLTFDPQLIDYDDAKYVTPVAYYQYGWRAVPEPGIFIGMLFALTFFVRRTRK